MKVVSGGSPVVEVAERCGVPRNTLRGGLRRPHRDGLRGWPTARTARTARIITSGQLAAEIEARICM
jgi:transposase-like protein